MRSILLASLLIITCACASARPRELQLHPDVAKSLEIFYQNMSAEFVFCAHGEVKSRIIRIDQLTVPRINSTDEWSLNFRPTTCPKKRLLGAVHSHPARSDMCNFSRLDLEGFLIARFRYDFVYCFDQRIAWNDRENAAQWRANLPAAPRGVLSQK